MNDLNSKNFTSHLKNYAVTYMFIALSVFFIAVSGLDINYVASQLLLRLNRNAFIVMALIIPIIAGMGINFSITIGAMAAQIGLLLTISWGVTGVPGILLAAGITLPLGLIFGYLIGSLLNRMKGQETIGSLILGYFANGAYQLLFLFIFGGIIPLSDKVTIVGATGVQNTLNLTGSVGLSTAIDSILRVPFLQTVYVLAAVVLAGSVVLWARKKITKTRFLALSIGRDPHPRGHLADHRRAVPVQRHHHAHPPGAEVPRGGPEPGRGQRQRHQRQPHPHHGHHDLHRAGGLGPDHLHAERGHRHLPDLRGP